jgi:hypothetical protein
MAVDAAAQIEALGAETPAGAAAQIKSANDRTRLYRRPALPQVLGRVSELTSAAAVNHLRMYFTGDSLAQKIPDELLENLKSTIGIAGKGFSQLRPATLSGTVSIASDFGETDADRTKFWETGSVHLISSGGSMKIGDNVASVASPILANKISLYLGTETGNGSATVYVSYNNGSTWETALETYDTNAALGVAVRTYTVATNREIIIRIDASGGPVQVIGAVLWDSTRSGAIISRSGRSGATLAQYLSSSTAPIRAAVMADLAPHLIFGMFSESLDEIASAPAWLDLVLASSSTSDVCMANLPSQPHRDELTYTSVINAAWDAAAATRDRVFIYDIHSHFKSIGYPLAAGFADSDVHMTGRADLAWKSVATDLTTIIGLTSNPVMRGGRRSSTLSVVDHRSHDTGVFRLTTATNSFSETQQWFDPTTGTLDNHSIGRQSTADGQNPAGLEYSWRINDTPLTYMMIDTSGGVKLGIINTGSTTTATTDGARFFVSSGTPSKIAAILSGSSLQTADILKVTSRSSDVFALDLHGRPNSANGYAHGFDGTGPTWTACGFNPAGATATITIAAPGVITLNAHGLVNGMAVKFSTDGALPTGITAGTTYYVRNATANTFNLSTTYKHLTATVITTSGSQSGTHTMSVVAPNGSLLSRTDGTGGLWVMVSGTWVEK